MPIEFWIERLKNIQTALEHEVFNLKIFFPRNEPIRSLTLYELERSFNSVEARITAFDTIINLLDETHKMMKEEES